MARRKDPNTKPIKSRRIKSRRASPMPQRGTRRGGRSGY